MTAADWIALLGIALPLAAKVAVDVAAFLAARKHTALARIVGMAGRLAANDARALAAAPSGINVAALERMLISNSTQALIEEMAPSLRIVGGDQKKAAGIMQGELNKVLTAPAAPSSLTWLSSLSSLAKQTAKAPALPAPE